MAIPFVLTRYLYIKEDVYISLVKSVFEKDYDKSLFWASELYFSGFKQDAVEFIHSIYSSYFKSHNPRLQRIMDIALEKFDHGIHMVATMLLNLTSKARKFTVKDFVLGNQDQIQIEGAFEEETKIIVFSDVVSAHKYCDFIDADLSPRDVLKNACLYKSCQHLSGIFNCSYNALTQKELHDQHLYHWLYYAYYSPIWEKRIEKYNVTINHDTKEIVFHDEEELEKFYEYFGYDVDEQPKEVEDKIMHTTLWKQFTNDDFLQTYDLNKKIKIKKLKRVDNVGSQGEQNAAP